MGTDPHGLVFYGFPLVAEDGEPVNPWASEDEDDENEEELDTPSPYTDWEEIYLKAKGLAESTDDVKTWREKRRTTLDAGGVDVVLAGYGECLIDCIVIKESYVRAEWGEVLPLKTLETKPEWDGQLREWCETLGIEYRQPGWFVAALYF